MEARLKFRAPVKAGPHVVTVALRTGIASRASGTAAALHPQFR